MSRSSYVTEGPEHVLDEMIAFSHMEADCFMIDMVQLPFNLVKMKRAFSDWQYKLAGRGWNALYIENHDHPRIISRYGNEAYRNEAARCWLRCICSSAARRLSIRGRRSAC